MNEAYDPPQDILSSKSIVLMDVPKGISVEERLKLADELQAFFAKVGVDAAAYFQINSFSSVSGMQEQIPDFILKRDIKNLIFLTVLNQEDDFILGMGPFNGKHNFYDKGASFWLRRTTDLETVFSELTTRLKTDAFPKENLLLSNSAEFFEPTVSGFKQAYVTLPKDFEGKKIAIPRIDINPFAEPNPQALSIAALTSANMFKKELSDRSHSYETLATKDSVLYQIISVENKTDADLRRTRVDYVLHYIEADAQNVYTFLPFEKREENKTGVLVKFFLRDTRTNIAFLGSNWDAKEDWNEALNSFIAQINSMRGK
ncbi:hypothetical protein [Roseivirga echinicomitans]|nr:hypothetical protein [Roseivirga echinicomitans]